MKVFCADDDDNDNHNSKDQCHLALSAIAAHVLIGRRGSRAMAPLDRALLSFYRMSVVTIQLSVTVGRSVQCKFNWGFDSEISFPWEEISGAPV